MYITIGNVKIHYIKEGEGKAILFLHGWGCNVTYYQYMMHQLKGQFQVIALDFPGFGNSEEPPIPWGVSEYTELVLELIKALQLQEVSLIGHSFGGRVIIKLATMEQSIVTIRRIVLIDAAGIKSTKTWSQKWKIATYKVGKRILLLPIIKQLYPKALENMQNRSGSEDYRLASPLMKQVLVKTVNEDLSHLLEEIRQSTLLIWGELDTATPLRDGKLMETLIPDSGLVVLKNGSHFAYLEQKEYVSVILAEFFKTY
ncbi:MAG: alpha/beta hydrolase [Eubacteriales bacterium]